MNTQISMYNECDGDTSKAWREVKKLDEAHDQ